MTVFTNKKFIWTVTIILPLAVAALKYIPKFEGRSWTSSMPLFSAIINSITAIVLVWSVVNVKKGNIEKHRKGMITALILSTLFLLNYVFYHITNEDTPYPEEAPLRYVYYFILITHIFLSGIIVPMVLFTLRHALMNNIEQHRRLAKITFPLWLYVAVTGVLVYVFMAPYYH